VFVYNAKAPTIVNRKTMPEMTKGALSTDPMVVVPMLLDVGVEVETAPPPLPEPESTSPVEVEPAHCEPSPFRPGPGPAPSVRYYF
jgi:hypothetical protein